ncbi:hypothetical protein BDF19DRAFT_421276 [Syncephalis fuscata]|nr:hypothetical protein BDF19DRAFT_421276 [Syncephalis fuscata]
MPKNTNNEHLGIAWLKNATHFGNIPLHPLGELDIFGFMTMYPDDLELSRIQMSGTRFQMLINILLALMFARNLRNSLNMVMMRSNALSSWCCFLPSVYGRAHVQHIIVLQRAYLVLCKNRAIAVIGVLFMVPQIGCVIILLCYCPITIEPLKGCVVNYPAWQPWFWFVVSAPINTLFSAIFSRIAYRQYRAFGSDAWKNLSRNGVQTMCLVVLCNIACATVVLFEIGGDFSSSFYVLDWLMTSTILIGHCRQMRNIAIASSDAKKESKRRRKADVGPPRIAIIPASECETNETQSITVQPYASSLLTRNWILRPPQSR